MKKKGFTFIELLIVVAIIAIVSAIILVSVKDSRVKQELGASMREVSAGIRTAQNYALSGTRRGAHRPCSFRYSVASNRYDIDGYFYDPFDASSDINGDNVVDCTDNLIHFDVSSNSLPKGVDVKGFYKGKLVDYLSFLVPYGEVLADGATIDKPVLYMISKKGLNYALCVYPSGKIEELGQTNSSPACP